MTYGVFTDDDRQRARELEEWHGRWEAQQVAKGVNPSTPLGRPDPSDYNQHGPDIEADGPALDRFFRRANQIMSAEPVTAAADAARTGAMVAFIPSDEHIARLAMRGREEPEQLHMTALYLGEAADWDELSREQLLAAAQSVAEQIGTIEADGFSVATFNPKGDEPAIALGISGHAAADAQAAAATAFAPFAACMPEQHRPHVSHVTLAYANPDDLADFIDDFTARTGPIAFDRIRVAFAGDNFDFPLTGPSAPDDPQVAAVTAPVDPTIIVQPIPLDVAPAATDGTAFEGVCVAEGVWTGDRRFWAENSLTFAPFPWSLKWPQLEGEDHNGAAIVGRVDSAVREGNLIRIRGVMDDGPDGGEYGREAARLMARQMLRGASIMADDVDQVDIETIYPEPVVVVDVPMETPPELVGEPVEPMYPPDSYASPGEPATIIHAGRIRSVTLLSEPAFVESVITLTTAADLAPVAAPPLVAAGHTITLPDVPPDWWFDEPTDVVMATALTVTDEGRIYGLLAPDGVAHRAYKGKRLTVPMNNVDYSRFLGRQTIVAGGGRRVTGVITMDCGHCPPGASADPAVRMKHYDDSCSVVADINIIERPGVGVIVAGALKHYVTAEQVSKLGSCVLSGDWAPHPERPGMREFVAALLVPVPGFPMSTKQSALTASMRVDEQRDTYVSRVPVLIASAVDHRAAFDEMARKIGVDPLSKLAALREKVGGGDS